MPNTITDEYAYKVEGGRWVAGFQTRNDAIQAGVVGGRTQITTAKVTIECPSYFARFEAKTILKAMINGLQCGEKDDKLIGGSSAIDYFTKLENSAMKISDSRTEEFNLSLDLMNRLEATVASWITENNLQFDRPKFIDTWSEELHVSGPNLNIQLL